MAGYLAGPGSSRAREARHGLGTAVRDAGPRARSGTTVVPGAPAAEPRQVVQAHLDGTLSAGGNLCDHGAGERRCEH